MKRKQEITSVRWDLALRYRLIETVAWWEGRLTTGHLMQSFGISRQQASADSTPFGHSAHADPDTCSTLIRTGS
ncbi:hypothetical protein BV581_21155, partial [Stutzerimonas stutzeri]